MFNISVCRGVLFLTVEHFQAKDVIAIGNSVRQIFADVSSACAASPNSQLAKNVVCGNVMSEKRSDRSSLLPIRVDYRSSHMMTDPKQFATLTSMTF